MSRMSKLKMFIAVIIILLATQKLNQANSQSVVQDLYLWRELYLQVQVSISCKLIKCYDFYIFYVLIALINSNNIFFYRVNIWLSLLY